MVKLMQLFKAGLHLGHHKRQWNPKMASFLYGERNGIHILDLLQTAVYLENTCRFIGKILKRKKKVLLVGTKREAAELVATTAQRCNIRAPQGVHYVNHRWLGGMLTNWSTMKLCIAKLKQLDVRERTGDFLQLPKKEAAMCTKQRSRLQKYLGGVKNMDHLPHLVMIIGQPDELNAVYECRKLKIKNLTLLDSDCDPDLADFFIPSNDDSVEALDFILNTITLAVRREILMANDIPYNPFRNESTPV
uniref:Small ribosomal subunit protein uS2c n=1 Tax=Nephroselmis astigmatica TaxID=259378 RepID=A0A088CJF4_9CHLO|nr:ribosomal protein S2 [Nephroselmis astigmatica]AID67731.1 ribosomal protein S2 [Nephroselmis astigmatica]